MSTTAIAFYCGHLGFTEVMHPAPTFAMLSRGDLRLTLSAPGGPGGGGARRCPTARMPDPGRMEPVRHRGRRPRAAGRRARAAAGAHFRNDIVTGVGGRQILVDDPSGNPVELFEPIVARSEIVDPLARPPPTVGGPVVSAHPDLEAEQAYIVAAYDHLAAMQGRTSVVFEKALDDAAPRRRQRRCAGDASRQAARAARRRRPRAVLRPDRRGRHDTTDAETFYVGRRHVETPKGDPVVVDWRARGLGPLLPSHSAATRSG